MAVRVIIADQNADVLRALNALLNENPNYEVVGKFTSIDEPPQAYAELQPDLVLMDWQFCSQGRGNLIGFLAKQKRPPKVIVMSNNADRGRLALAVGAHAFISKGDPVDWLLEALRLVSAEESSGADNSPDREEVA